MKRARDRSVRTVMHLRTLHLATEGESWTFVKTLMLYILSVLCVMWYLTGAHMLSLGL